jgi:hypothetical protein
VAETTHPLPALWPAAQQVVRHTVDVPVPSTVAVVTGKAADRPAVDVVTSTLRGLGARKISVMADPPRSAALTVYVGGPAENARTAAALGQLKAADPGGLPAEGYVLASGRNGDGGTVALAGADPDGTFHAAQTLRQLAAGGFLPGVVLRDWPAMKVRGVIEGFYGTPWSQQDRLAALDFDARVKFNTYVYSPKDDPYLRARWRDPYPAPQLAQIRTLVDRAAADHVRFTYALSPGLSACYSDPADAHALVAKFESLWAIGVRAFAVPLDDISYGDWHCADDRAHYGTGPAAAGTAQADLLNQVQRQFIATHPGVRPLEFVPTEYHDSASSPYKTAIRTKLDRAVVVEWTGFRVVAPAITPADAAAARKLYGHDLLVWDNYPVNDYVTNRLLLGPYVGRDPGLSGGLAGITANPMIQEEASKIALFGVAAYTWHPDGYDPNAAWTAALHAVGGKAYGALRVFAENSYSSRIQPTESPTLAPMITDFWTAWAKGDVGNTAATLSSYFATMAAAPAQLRSGVDNATLVTEIAPWLDELGAYGQAGGHAVAMLEAKRSGDTAKAAAERAQVQAIQAQVKRSTVVVGAGVLDPFLTRALDS